MALLHHSSNDLSGANTSHRAMSDILGNVIRWACTKDCNGQQNSNMQRELPVDEKNVVAKNITRTVLIALIV